MGIGEHAPDAEASNAPASLDEARSEKLGA
jgi:hypothetical protein